MTDTQVITDSGLSATESEGPSGLIGMDEASQETELQSPDTDNFNNNDNSVLLTQGDQEEELRKENEEESTDIELSKDKIASDKHPLTVIGEDSFDRTYSYTKKDGEEETERGDVDVEAEGESEEECSDKEEVDNDAEFEDDVESELVEDEEVTLTEREKRQKLIESMLENDDMWDTDLEDDDDSNKDDIHDTTGRVLYRKTCEKLGVVPVKYFLKHIGDSKLCMKYHGLGAPGTQAIAKPLTQNLTITYLDLRGNWMEEEGGEAIGKMLEENSYITHCILSDNKLGDVGVSHIFKGLTDNVVVTTLDLSGNSISDLSGEALCNFLMNNKTIISLNLSRNLIGSEGAIQFAEGVCANEYIEDLDLSSNSISHRGAVLLINSLKENIRIKKCSLAWNGLGGNDSCVKALSDLIRINEVLQEFDISGNRLPDSIAPAIGISLSTNETLKILKMGNNFIRTTYLLKLISSLSLSESSVLEFLSLKDVPVDFEFVKVVERLESVRPTFHCEHGPVLRAGNTMEELTKQGIDIKSPIIILKEHILVNDFRFVKRLQELDDTGTQTVTVEQFTAALEEIGAPCFRSNVKEIQVKLDKFKNGTIYYGDFIPPSRPERDLPL